MRYLRAEGASKMDEPQAGAFIMSCLERPVVRLLDVAVCFLVAMDEVALFVSGGLGGWAAATAGDPLVLIPKLLRRYKRQRDSMERIRVFAKGFVRCCC